MTDIRKGGCQCGAVEYEFIGSPQTIHACHCSECQKRSGSAFGLTMVVNRKNFTITGQVSTYVRAADSGQTNTSYFCPNCGNPIYGEVERLPDIVAIRPGTLDDTSWFKPERHQWTDSAQSWFEFPEGCEVLPKGRW